MLVFIVFLLILLVVGLSYLWREGKTDRPMALEDCISIILLLAEGLALFSEFIFHLASEADLEQTEPQTLNLDPINPNPDS